MFKLICLFAIIAVAAVAADPKPGVLAYSAPLLAAAPGAAVYERTYHGNFAPLAAYASAPYIAAPYAAAPLAYSAPYVAAAPAPVLFK
ncbi:cuticle protein 16.5-like [Topomyia yanbarensis]|uniref:cuticle protein 16.5-like n=1 Tax=Topomyia yanbarensis TaxID=2498891 RepID=UPI00273BED77|nr:cuticle protein 16.5-like [Topomyia yanbarensis]